MFDIELFHLRRTFADFFYLFSIKENEIRKSSMFFSVRKFESRKKNEVSMNFLEILVLASVLSVSTSLKCYISVIPYVFNYNVTGENLPSFENNTLVDAGAIRCAVTFLWLRVQPQSMIIFGFDLDPTKRGDSLSAFVQYQKRGEQLEVDLSRSFQYFCDSADACNNESNIKMIFDSLYLWENFQANFDFLIDENPVWSNETAAGCFSFKNSTENCFDFDPNECQRCQIRSDTENSMETKICATCPRLGPDANFIKRSVLFDLSNRSIEREQTEIWCQNSSACNSIGNVFLLRQQSVIRFQFEKSSAQTFNTSIQILFCLSLLVKLIFD